MTVKPSEGLLCAVQLSHAYPRGKTALTDVNLSMGTGALGLLGPNGAGKSTLLRILATTLRSTGGSVQFGDADINTNLRHYRSKLGYLPQRFGFLPHFTVSEFLEYAAWLKLVPSSQRPRQVKRALEISDLGAIADNKMKKLSGGMLRRVGIAQAVVNEPSVLLLDEPTVGLDPEQRTHLRTILRSLSNQVVLIVSTHLTEDIAAICNRTVILDGGRVRFDGSRQELEQIGSDQQGPDSVLERGYTSIVRAARTR